MSHLTLTAVRTDTQEILGDLSRHSLYEARIWLRFSLLFMPEVPREFVAIWERERDADGELLAQQFHFLSADDSSDNMESLAAQLRELEARAGDWDVTDVIGRPSA